MSTATARPAHSPEVQPQDESLQEQNGIKSKVGDANPVGGWQNKEHTERRGDSQCQDVEHEVDHGCISIVLEHGQPWATEEAGWLKVEFLALSLQVLQVHWGRR